MIYFILITSYSLLPTSSFQLLTSNFQLPTFSFQLLTSNFPLPTSHFQLLTSFHKENLLGKLLISHLLFLTSYFLPLTSYSYFLLPTSHFLLQTSHFQLPTSHFQLPTSNFQLLKTSSMRRHRHFFRHPTSPHGRCFRDYLQLSLNCLMMTWKMFFPHTHTVQVHCECARNCCI